MQRQDVAALLHIGAAGVHYLAAAHADFPAPVTTVRVGGRSARLWWRPEVQAWAAAHGYLSRGQRTAPEPAPVAAEPGGALLVVRAAGQRRYARRAR